MKTQDKIAGSVDTYIAQAPDGVQKTLSQIRATIQKAAPHATESISYGMPGYKIGKKPIAYFGAFAHHIGFYATPHGHEAFQDRLAQYKQGKGSVQFPLDQPMPLQLIADMVAYNAKESDA